MEWIVIPITIALGMLGGQMMKWTRRFGIPLSSLAVVVSKEKTRKDWKKYVLALLALVLSMGYGENSKLSKLCGGRDWLVRMVYGVLLGIIVAVAGFVYGVIIMPLIWVLHIPYSFKIGKYDFLWEDFVRYSGLGFCIWRCLV